MRRSLSDRTIRTIYPCCEGVARLHPTVHTLRETYDRVCPECRTRWLVERRTLNSIPGITIDLLDWTDKNTRLYTRKYGG
jgi:hypothetical protein